MADCPPILGAKGPFCVLDADGVKVPDLTVDVAVTHDAEDPLVRTGTQFYNTTTGAPYDLPAGHTLSTCCCDPATGGGGEDDDSLVGLIDPGATASGVNGTGVAGDLVIKVDGQDVIVPQPRKFVCDAIKEELDGSNSGPIDSSTAAGAQWSIGTLVLPNLVGDGFTFTSHVEIAAFHTDGTSPATGAAIFNMGYSVNGGALVLLNHRYVKDIANPDGYFFNDDIFSVTDCVDWVGGTASVELFLVLHGNNLVGAAGGNRIEASQYSASAWGLGT